MTPGVKLALVMGLAMLPVLAWAFGEARRQWLEDKDKRRTGDRL